MPSWSRPIVVDGVVVGRACGRSPDRKCVTCRKRATIQCDFPVSRPGKGSRDTGTCDRWCCRNCAIAVGPDRDHCVAHARLGGAQP